MAKKQKINIFGEIWTIVDGELEGLIGCTDKSIKEITLDSKLSAEPEANDIQDLDQYKRVVLRHELVHAMFHESGLGDTEIYNNESVVDWIAQVYPKMKKIFESAGVED